MANWTESEKRLAEAGYVYWRFRYCSNHTFLREKCRDLQQVKSGHGVLVFDYDAYNAHHPDKILPS